MFEWIQFSSVLYHHCSGAQRFKVFRDIYMYVCVCVCVCVCARARACVRACVGAWPDVARCRRLGSSDLRIGIIQVQSFAAKEATLSPGFMNAAISPPRSTMIKKRQQQRQLWTMHQVTEQILCDMTLKLNTKCTHRDENPKGDGMFCGFVTTSLCMNSSWRSCI